MGETVQKNVKTGRIKINKYNKISYNWNSSEMQNCEGQSLSGYDRIEAGYRWDCKSYSLRPEEWWLDENNAHVTKWNIDNNAVNTQKAYIKKKCDGIYNAPWIGKKVICNGDPSAYWGTSDGKFVPNNGGDYLWWQCQPGDRCK